MDKTMCLRERYVDLEHNAGVSTSRSKSSTATIFPPILQSQPTSPETQGLEEPPLCKSVVHVHLKASEKQQKVDTAWLDKKKGGSTMSSMNPPSVCSNSDNCSRIVSSVWEQAHEEDEKAEIMLSLPGPTSTHSAAHLIKQKLKVYGQQWKDGISMQSKWTVIEACSRVTCSNLVWCLVLGTWLEQKTERKWGIVETVLANAVCGCLFELLGGQAILIVGPSSPSLIFIVAISTSAQRLGVDAVPWMGWIGLWGSLVLLLLAMSNASKLIAHVTLFSWEVVCVFIRLTFLWGALEQLSHMFTPPAVSLDSALLSLWLATTVFFVASLLENARQWRAFHRQTRDAMADYGPLLVLLLFTAVPHLPKLTQPHISQVSLPESGYHTDQTTRLGCISLRVLPFWAILLAVIPGIMLAGMIFIYQNATTTLLQEKAGLTLLDKSSKKWDLCIVAFLTFLCSLFGLPYTCGMLYQSRVHVRALTLKLHEYSDMEEQRGLVFKVAVQRISGLGASILPAAFLFPPVKWVVKEIPSAVLTGLFLKLACQSWGSWNIVTFISTFFHKTRSKSQGRVSISALCVCSAAQISCIFVVFTVSKTPAAVMFPLFIITTLWVRHYAMRGLFRREAFAKLDAELSKDCSDLSSSGQLSMASHDMHAHARSRQAWPKLTISQTLKSAITAPMADVHTHHPSCMDTAEADAAAESSEPPLPRTMNPSLLFASNRRLKERSRRRYKRKRQASLENAETSAKLYTDHAPIPPLVKAMMQEHNYPSYYEQEEEINLSKRVSPRLSPQFFKKSKQKAGQERPLEVHSNLLYEPKSKSSAARKLAESKSKKQSEGASTSAAAAASAFHESEIQSSTPKQEIMVFQGSPGIGRCIRSPTAFKIQSPTSAKRKQLQLSISIPRRKAFPREEIYPGSIGGGGLLDEHARKIYSKPMLVYPRLRRSSTSRWPTTSHAPHLHAIDQQQQRHSTSMSKDEIGFMV